MALRSAITAGQKLTNCKVVEENEIHWFLTEPGAMYYDIVMQKDWVPANRKITIGMILNVVVEGINIAPDGRPGVFVKPA